MYICIFVYETCLSCQNILLAIETNVSQAQPGENHICHNFYRFLIGSHHHGKFIFKWNKIQSVFLEKSQNILLYWFWKMCCFFGLPHERFILEMDYYSKTEHLLNSMICFFAIKCLHLK